ncbi:glycosyltransferase 87 family protein [Actinomyces timonensis]|uniref:Glycosyltransferase 87 family protein n=1 Tax=Actinomyces timonensis TaxID=1288391 RepID=A0AAU8N1Y3_9ACTO
MTSAPDGAPTRGTARERALEAALSSPALLILGCVGLLLIPVHQLWDDLAPSFKLDAWIYYHAMAQWRAGGSLYDWYANPGQRTWPFTYPPFAAWVFTPLLLITDRAAQILLTALTPWAAALTGWASLRCLGARGRAARAGGAWLALVGCLVAEPLDKTMEYGQINAILMMLVALDLLVVPAGSRWRGVGSAVAAAIKLTPAIAILVFLVRREWRAAAAWVASPRESARFFGQAMLDPSRAGLPDYSGNQSLRGLVARALPEGAWGPAWAGLALLAVIGAALLARALGRGASASDGLILLLQTDVVMTCGLLVSPISWSHHWVWCLPLLIGLGAASWRWCSPALMTATASGGLVFALAMHWWFPEQNHVEQDWPWWAGPLGSSYTLWALAAGAALWVRAPLGARPDGGAVGAPTTLGA